MEPLIRPEYVEKLIHEIIIFLPRIPIAVILFFVGVFLIRMVLKAFRFALSRRGVEPTLVSFLNSVAYAILQVILIITVASTVGIATTSFVAMLGAAGLAIGLALQGSLSNFAGSVLLMVFKPFKVGDLVAAQNQEGIVKDINIFYTVLHTGDMRKVIIPNGKLASDVIINITAESIRRVEIKVGIGYSDDFSKAKAILLDLANSDPQVLMKPLPPFVGLNNLGDSAQEIVFRMWVDAVDHWPVYYSMMEKIKTAFDENGIDIPFPQRVMHMIPPPEKGEIKP